MNGFQNIRFKIILIRVFDG